MNPVRSLGPDLVMFNLSHYWVYVIGPLLGAILAVLAAWVLRGPGGDLAAAKAAQGALDSLVLSEQPEHRDSPSKR